MAIARRVRVAIVRLWGEDAGAVAWDRERGTGAFEYTEEFIAEGLEIAPLTMPLAAGRIYSFPGLNKDTYVGLPGLLADSLPDRFGNALIDIWLAREGRDKADFSPVERLCYMGTRGMGALEFRPAIGPRARKAIPIEVEELAKLAADVLTQRQELIANLDEDREEALKTIIRVGTSAGGARAKAVIAWNPTSGEVRSGQVAPPEGFEPWILKFDGVNKEALGDPEGFGRVEFAYHRMAVAAGMEMTACRLLEEGGRAHFMTRRFDRSDTGEKTHIQSLCAMAHYDYNAPGEYSYEQAFAVIQKLKLGYPTMEEMFRRMTFNVLARNQDDHTKNITFLMDRGGSWSLAPAYDVIWSHRSDSPWVARHQMRVNGKLDGFTAEDLLAVAGQYGIRKAKDIVGQVGEAVSRWSEFAVEAGVDREMIREIGRKHRLEIV